MARLHLSGAAVLFGLLAVAWAAPASLSPWDTVANLGDPLHLAWVLASNARRLVTAPWALFEANAFHPYARSLTFGDHLLPESLLVAPVFWATGNAVLTFNAAVVLGLFASALAMFVFVRSVTGCVPAAVLAGLAYAFNSFTQHELPRVHVLHLQWWPLSLLFLDRFTRGGSSRDAGLWALTLLLQGLSGSYYLAYSILFAPVWIAAGYLGVRRRPGPAEARTLAAAAGAALVVATMVAWPYVAQVRALDLVPRHSAREVLVDLPPPRLDALRAKGFEANHAAGADLLAYVDPPEGHPLLGRWHGLAPASELPHFVGIVGLLLMAAGVGALARGAPERRGPGLAAVATLVSAVAFSMGTHLRVAGHGSWPGPYELLQRLTPLARGPERFGALVLLAMAILIGLGAAAILRTIAPRWRVLAAALLGAALVAEQWVPPRDGARVPAGAAVPRVYRWLAEQGEGPIVELPLHPLRTKRLWAAYLYFSTYHWRRLPIGRASLYPPAHERLAWELGAFPDEVSLGLLARLGIDTVVVHPKVWAEEERKPRLAALDAESRLTRRASVEDGSDARFAPLGLGDERVYALAPGPPPRPSCTPSDEIARGGWTLEASGITRAELVRDGDRRTSWSTLEPQWPGDSLQVMLPRPEPVAAVVIEASAPFDEFPRGLVVQTSDGGAWRTLASLDGLEERWEMLERLLHAPSQARIVHRLREPRAVDRLLLTLDATGQDFANPRWSVPELRLYRRCE